MRRERLVALVLAVFLIAAAPVWAPGAMIHRRPAHGRLGARFHSAHLAAAPVGTWGHGAWSWFGDPRAVYVAGQFNEIFAGWLDWSGGVTVGAYDPQFGVTRKQVIGSEFHDDHGAPSILVEPDLRLTAFWSGDNGARMYYRSTLRPEDISAWGPLQHAPSNVAGTLGFT